MIKTVLLLIPMFLSSCKEYDAYHTIDIPLEPLEQNVDSNLLYELYTRKGVSIDPGKGTWVISNGTHESFIRDNPFITYVDDSVLICTSGPRGEDSGLRGIFGPTYSEIRVINLSNLQQVFIATVPGVVKNALLLNNDLYFRTSSGVRGKFIAPMDGK
jgi:hypothetical protein